MSGKITPKVRSPLRDIPLKLELESRDEMVHAVKTYAYSRRTGHIQFDVQLDTKNCGGGKVSFICPNPSCTWRVDCSISRQKNTNGKTRVTNVINHSAECMGSRPVPDLTWLCRHSILSSCALRAKSLQEVIDLADSLGLSVGKNQASLLRIKVKEESVAEYNTTFRVIEPWLKEFCRLNPGAQHVFRRNAITKQFECCFLLLPCELILANSFLGTLMLDCGFSVDPSRRTSQCYVLTLGDRQNKNTPFGIGFKETEDAEG
jgi:hypothetical protein